MARLTIFSSIFSLLLLPCLLSAQTGNNVDFDGNGEIEFADFLAFAQAYGSQKTRYDLNANGQVDFPDFLTFGRLFRDRPVNFPDPAVEAAVREAIGRSTGEIRAVDLVEVTYLSISDQDLKDLTGLGLCTGLKALEIEKGQFVDVSPLANLTRLIRLRIRSHGDGGNFVSDISPLANLTALEELHLGGNPIHDLTPLSNLTNLRTLWIRGGKYTDISALADLNSLRSLELGSNELTDISVISNLQGLERFILTYSPVSDLSPLANLKSLRWVLLSYNKISDLSPLGGLRNLEELHLDGNSITHIAPLLRDGLLESGDVVIIRRNPLSENAISWQIPLLESRGVTVVHDGN